MLEEPRKQGSVMVRSMDSKDKLLRFQCPVCHLFICVCFVSLGFFAIKWAQ